MLRFRLLTTEVRAVQIGADGTVEIDGHRLLGDATNWVVIDAQGFQTTWSDPEFRVNFEPVDEEAEKYLSGKK